MMRSLASVPIAASMSAYLAISSGVCLRAITHSPSGMCLPLREPDNTDSHRVIPSPTGRESRPAASHPHQRTHLVAYLIALIHKFYNNRNTRCKNFLGRFELFAKRPCGCARADTSRDLIAGPGVRFPTAGALATLGPPAIGLYPTN